MTWRPDSGVTPNRPFVMASLDVWHEYHARRRAVFVDWPALRDIDDWEINSRMRNAALADIRSWVVARVRTYKMTGAYLIPC